MTSSVTGAVPVTEERDRLQDLDALKKELTAAQEKLSETERLNARVNIYNDELRRQLDALNEERSTYRKSEEIANSTSTLPQEKTCTSACLTESENFSSQGQEVDKETGSGDQSADLSLDKPDNNSSSNQDPMYGDRFVFDHVSGLYYDHISGYYYDAERSLYYEPQEGKYYQYDSETQSYSILSDDSGVMVSSQSNEQTVSMVSSRDSTDSKLQAEFEEEKRNEREVECSMFSEEQLSDLLTSTAGSVTMITRNLQAEAETQTQSFDGEGCMKCVNSEKQLNASMCKLRRYEKLTEKISQICEKLKTHLDREPSLQLHDSQQSEFSDLNTVNIEHIETKHSHNDEKFYISINQCYEELKGLLSEFHAESAKLPFSYQREMRSVETKAQSGDLVHRDHVNREEFDQVVKKLAKLERSCSSMSNYNEELRNQIELLNTDLHVYRRATRNRKNAETQADSSCGFSDGENKFDQIGLPQNDTEDMVDIAATICDPTVTMVTNSSSNVTQQETELLEEREEGELSLAESLRETAKDAMKQTGYVFDENSGLYYDYKSGYYYDGENGLYYEPNSGTYYYYDENSGSYQIHSRVDVSQYHHGHHDHDAPADESAEQPVTTDTVAVDTHIKHKKHKKHSRETSSDEKENSVSEVTSALGRLQIDKKHKSLIPESMGVWPPCIRVIVTESDHLPVGSLYIITCMGATIGREKDMGHSIQIPDLQISKMHAQIWYDEGTQQYVIKDHASQNGTFLNSIRIAEPKVMSQIYPIKHGDILKLGGSTLLLHIHRGTETCDECEPGQVQASIQQQNTDKEEVQLLSKAQREKQRRQELKRIKKKFGLGDSAYVDNKQAIDNPTYQNRAQERRINVGSDNPYQRDDLPASVHRAIPSENVGHKMLQKMGWKEGSSLGKSQVGLKEPIQIKFRTKSLAGLGQGSCWEHSIDNVADAAAAGKWVKVQERYQNIDKEQTDAQTDSPSQSKTWVQGETYQPMSPTADENS